MNNATKMTSLVAVLVLCCAALAGSAYAYNATYVDTIGDQDIEDVYLVLSAVEGKVGKQDVDVEYNTYTKTVIGDDESRTTATYYQLLRATIDNENNAMAKVNTDGKTATICVLIDTVSVKAFGDDAKLDSMTINDDATTFNGDLAGTYGITAKLYLSKTEITSVDALDMERADIKTVTYGDNEGKIAAKATAVVAYAYLVIDVNQLGAAAPAGYPANYFADSKICDAEIAGFDIAYTAKAHQDTASA